MLPLGGRDTPAHTFLTGASYSSTCNQWRRCPGLHRPAVVPQHRWLLHSESGRCCATNTRMYIHACTHALAHRHARRHTHEHTRTHARTHTRAQVVGLALRTHSLAHAHARAHPRTHARSHFGMLARLHAGTLTRANQAHARITRAGTHTHAHAHTNTQTHTHTHTHTHTCTHTRAHTHRWSTCRKGCTTLTLLMTARWRSW